MTTKICSCCKKSQILQKFDRNNRHWKTCNSCAIRHGSKIKSKDELNTFCKPCNKHFAYLQLYRRHIKRPIHLNNIQNQLIT